MEARHVVDADLTPGRSTHNGSRFILKLAALAAGGGLVGLAITLALGDEEPFGPKSWSRTTLLLVAVVLAAGTGALIHRTMSTTGQLTEDLATRLEQASTSLDSALREAADDDSPRVQAGVDAVSHKLDTVNAELAALRRSGNRTAWATFLLGTLLGVVTQVTLG